MRTIPSKAKRPNRQAFTAAARAYLTTQRDAFLASLSGAQAVRFLAHAREHWLLPTETLADLRPEDLWGVHADLYAERVRMGFVLEHQAKREIAEKVRQTIEALKNL